MRYPTITKSVGSVRKLTKTQEALKQRVQRSVEIYNELYEEYDNLPREKKLRFGLQTRINTRIQLELCVSERKAKEYMRLAKALRDHPSLNDSKNT